MVKRLGKSSASGRMGRGRMQWGGVGGAGEGTVATGVTMMGGRRFSTGMLVRGTHSTISSKH